MALFRRRGACMVIGAALVPCLLGLLPTTVAGAQERAGDIAGLPHPFDSWNVHVESHGEDENVLDLSFDSPLLGQRITSRVHLPTSYRHDGGPLPVLYYLHGTILSPVDNPALEPVTEHEALLNAVGPGGGARQTDIFRFEEQLDAAQFVVVAPDTSYEKTICQTCIWIDGNEDLLPDLQPATASALPADSFLHQELYPLVEAVFNVRADRGGRAVTGFSMGAVAAYLQGMRHPDRYAFTASISGILDVVDEPGGRAIWEGVGYMRDQGYGTAATNEAEWRGFNPMDLASNLSGIDHPVFSSTGDACLRPSSLPEPDCRAVPPVTNPGATAVETVIARQYALNSRALPAAGVTETRVQLPGVHGANNHRVYAEHLVPMANAVFARGVEDPEVFRYRTTAKRFSVWGYAFSVDRGSVEFLDVVDARRDASAFELRGSGDVAVLTPPEFKPGSVHRVVFTDDSGERLEREIVADDEGRLSIRVELDRGGVLNLAGEGAERLGVRAAGAVRVQVH